MVSIELYKSYVTVDNYSLRDDLDETQKQNGVGYSNDSFTLKIDQENRIIITTKDYNGNICKNKNVAVTCNRGTFRRTVRNGTETEIPKMTIFEYYGADELELSEDVYNEYMEYYNAPIHEATGTTGEDGTFEVIYFSDEWGFCTITVNEVSFKVYVTGWRQEDVMYGEEIDNDAPISNRPLLGATTETGIARKGKLTSNWYDMNFNLAFETLTYFVDESIRHMILYGVYNPKSSIVSWDDAMTLAKLTGKEVKDDEGNTIYPYKPVVAKRTLTYTPDIVWYINRAGELKIRVKGYDTLPYPQSIRLSYDLYNQWLDEREAYEWQQ